MGDLTAKLKPIMDSLIEDTINLWILIFERYRMLLLPETEPDGRLPLMAIAASFQEVVKNFGTVLSLGSKNKDKKRNLMLLERLVLDSEIEEFLIELVEDGLDMRKIDAEIIQDFMNAVGGIKALHRKKLNPDELDIDETKVKEESAPVIEKQ